VALLSWSGYLFCHKKLRRFSKNILTVEVRGRIMVHGIFEKQKYSKTNITEFRFETIITLIEVSRNLKVKNL